MTRSVVVFPPEFGLHVARPNLATSVQDIGTLSARSASLSLLAYRRAPPPSRHGRWRSSFDGSAVGKRGSIDARGCGEHSCALGLARALAVGEKLPVSHRALFWVTLTCGSYVSVTHPSLLFFYSNSRFFPYLAKVISGVFELQIW